MNGYFIFEDCARARAPPLEIALHELPIIAIPAIALKVHKESKLPLGKMEKKYGKDMYFGVRPNHDSDRAEYFVTPVRTYAIAGVLSYIPSQTDRRVQILSAWEDFFEVEFRGTRQAYIFNLCFTPYQDGRLF